MEREYLAYISYRHTPVDKEAAITIQRQLEHYRIPKSLRKDGKKRLGIVFRDTDELNISPDLSQSLCAALDNSEYLIVLCSPEYKESEWCRQEIVYFLKHHDIDNILPVLVNGTPSEAFPEEIVCRTVVDGKEMVSEPLAANVAAETVKEMKQNIKREYLRLVAKMLGCHYDELIQRQKHYERRRKTAVLGTAFAVMAAFVAVLLVKNAQINAQYQEVRRSQAQYLSKLAVEQYEQGDVKSALESALKILPEDIEDGPLVPEQMYALTRILNAYNNSYVPKSFIPLPAKDQKSISDDRKLLLSYSSDLIEAYDTSSGELCYTFEPNSFLRDNPGLVAGYDAKQTVYIYKVAQTEDGKFFVSTSFGIFELDVNDTSYFKYVGNFGSGSVDLYYKNGRLAACTSEKVTVYDCSSGNVLYEKDFNDGPDESPVKYYINSLSWNEDASLFAIGLGYENEDIQDGSYYGNNYEANKEEAEYFKENPALGLAVIDPVSGEITELSDQQVARVSFAGDAVAALHGEYYVDYPVVRSGAITGSLPIRYFAVVYNAASGESLYQSEAFLDETYNAFGFTKLNLEDNGMNSPAQYALWLGNTYMIFTDGMQDVLVIESLRADVVAVKTFKNAYPLLVLSNGTLQVVVFMDDSNTYYKRNFLELDATVKGVAEKDDEYYLLTDTGMIHCALSKWKQKVTVESKTGSLENYDAEVFNYYDSEQGKLRLVGYESSSVSRLSGEYSALELYSCFGEKPIFSYISDDPNNTVKACNVSKDGSSIFVLLQKANGSAKLYCFDIESGELNYSGKLSTKLADEDIVTDVQSAGFSEDGKTLWVTGTKTAHIYDIDGKVSLRSEYQSDNRIENPVLTAGGKHLVWAEGNYETVDLVFMSVKNGKIAMTCHGNSAESAYKVTILPTQNEAVAVYSNGTDVLIHDAENQKRVLRFLIPRESKVAVFANGTELLAAHDQTVMLYDLQTGELKSELELSHKPDRFTVDSGSDIFAVYAGMEYSSTNDDGWFLGGWYFISVDEDRNMCLTAFVAGSTGTGDLEAVSPSGGEIVAQDSEGFFFKRMLSFAELVEMALELK